MKRLICMLASVVFVVTVVRCAPCWQGSRVGTSVRVSPNTSFDIRWIADGTYGASYGYFVRDELIAYPVGQ